MTKRKMRGLAFGFPRYPSGTLTLTACAVLFTFTIVNPCPLTQSRSALVTESRKTIRAGVDLPAGAWLLGAGLVPAGAVVSGLVVGLRPVSAA